MFLRILLAAFLALAPSTSQTAIFDDGNDRKLIADLRKKPTSQLTSEEKAILGAANRIGTFALCGGEIGGNAFLVRYNGRPAIVTNAHMFMNNDGTLADCSGRMEDGAVYTPNIAWYGGTVSDVDKSFLLRKVKLEFPPANWLDVRATFQVAASQPKSEHDIVVFYLQDDISTDKMPDSNMRGFLKVSYTGDIQDRLYMLGTALDIEKGLMPVYQKKCPGGQLDGNMIIGNTCDAVPGSSGSLLAVMEDGELRFRGIQSSALIEILDPGDAADIDMLNHATSSTRLRQTGALE